jgi:tRNA(His) 5'-end guanylyltransferase
MSKLSDRIEHYASISDQKLMGKLPIIISINGSNFSKVTQLLDKPYCMKFSMCIEKVMMRLCNKVDGVIFAYQFNDEIILLLRTDQNIDTEMWYNGFVQKICSVTSSAATLYFNEAATALELNLTGEAIFTSKVFGVPNQAEAVNTLVYHQQQNFHTSIQSACLYNLLNKYDKNTIKDMLSGLNIDEKIDLLHQECQMNFNDYPVSFRRGVACYKAPKIIDGFMKNKWYIDSELPIFTKEQSFLTNIIRLGADIYRG